MRGLTVSLCLLAQGAVGQEIPQQGLWDQVHTRAISGDRLLFKGVELKLRNLACPQLGTESGNAAKGLLNTFLKRSGAFKCSVVTGPTGINWARCSVAERNGLKGRDIAQGMRGSGLCDWASDVDAQGA